VKRSYRIGRRRDADIIVSDRSVSRSHADLVVDGEGGYFLTDCGSRLGTFVLRDGGWEPVRQVFVGPDEPILLGDFETTVRTLLDGVEASSGLRSTTARLLPGAKRRVAAVLAADVVGYSRMMAQDEAGTLARFRAAMAEAIQPAIDREGGRVFKTIGDGFLVDFPEAAAALRAAVEMQRALAQRNAAQPRSRRLRLRVGINVGSVIADADDLFGDGVNLAARLEGIAEPGCIAISEAVHDETVDAVELNFVDWGAQPLKNLPAPVRVFHVDPLDGPTR